MKLTAESEISFTPQYMTVDGAPWFPVMGEIHYSRVPRDAWKEELLKMKAGGVDVVSAYSIWIHHEEVEGAWDFDGNHDLHAFLETIKECGMYCVLRIGPWAHGEARNGGFPDWLVQKEKEGKMVLRSDDPGYLAYVKTFYEKLWEQAKGLLLSDNGPIIGIQIENEYGHCGGLQGEEGEQHMRTLQAMAKEIGFIVPIYTATGWGGAVTGGMLPVMGGYCEAPWDQRLTEIEPSGNYIFTIERNDHNIGSDHGVGVGITFDMTKFPYLTAELGGGLQVTHHRRPIASAKDIAAMTMVKLGSGCNLLGYYMYHGGTNPDGKRTTLQECRETGYPNDLPIRSYDFNAPLREYGQITDTYREIRRITMFAKDYQDVLCRAQYVEQPGNPAKPEDLESLRTAVRCYEDTDKVTRGFLFVNNYQRRYAMAEHPHTVPTAYAADGTVLASFAPVDVKDGDFFMYPFNLKLGEALLRRANATPLCILHGGAKKGGDLYVFYTKDGVDADYQIEGDLGNNEILTLTDEEALHAYKAVLQGKEYLIISKADAFVNAEGGLELIAQVTGESVPELKVIPALPKVTDDFVLASEADDKGFAVYRYGKTLTNGVTADLTETGKGNGLLTVSGVSAALDDAFVVVHYEADTAKLYRSGVREAEGAVKENAILADSFYTGQSWEISMKELTGSEETAVFDVVLDPLKEGESMYLQTWPAMENGEACRFNGVETRSVYRLQVM